MKCYCEYLIFALLQQDGSIKKLLTEYQQKLQSLKSSIYHPPKGFVLYPLQYNHCGEVEITVLCILTCKKE